MFEIRMRSFTAQKSQIAFVVDVMLIRLFSFLIAVLWEQQHR
jgi:hypothetical protein